MTREWEPGTQYNYNDIVFYNGATYKIIQPHRSQGDWAPDVTPALWGRLQGHHQEEHHGGGGYGGGGYQQQHQQQPEKPQYNYGSGGNVPNPGPATPAAQPTEEEKKTNWFDLSDERKHQLEVGGGLVAGAAVLGGAFAAYKHHQRSSEHEKAEAWAMSNWLQEARNRTDQFNQRGPTSATTWILASGTNIPQGAIQCGKEKSGDPLYVCRAYYQGGLHLGKCGRHLGKGAVIGYDEKEIELDTYEVLLGDPSAVRWAAPGGPERPVEGGREQDGTSLLIAQAFYKESTQVGKWSTQLKGACFPYGGKEKIVDRCQVLVYN
jgi:hypothetical protein